MRGWVETAADRIQVTVNGQRALVNGNEFFVNALPLIEGENTITVLMDDSYRYAAQSQFTVSSEQQTSAAEWIDLQIDEPGGFAPLVTRLIAKPHLAYALAAGSANLQYQGPQGATITPVSATEYHLRFDSPGFYTLKYSVADTQGNIYSRQALVIVMTPITEADWLAMKGQVQGLDDYFSSAVASMDVQTARLKTLQRALENPDFSQVVLSSSGTLCLVYQGKIPFILDLPDSNSPPID